MARFSDLPNELIISIWSYVVEPQVEPQSVESFALVSKRVYELAKPFVEEHQRLRQRYAKIFDLEKGKHGRAAGLLEAILLNPRVAVYINEFQLPKWAYCWEDQDITFQVQSYATKTMEVFEDAVRSLSQITPLEAENLVADIRSGHEGPLLALILIRLTKLKKLEIHSCGWNSEDDSLNLVLGDWSWSSESLGHPRPSTIGSTRHPDNEAFLQSPKFSHISDLEIKFCDIKQETISQLLGSTKILKSFSYHECFSSVVEPYQVCNELLECSRQSLQKLCLISNDEMNLEEIHVIRDAISRFEILQELEIGIVLLRGCEDEDCNTLIDMLPISIKKVSLSSTRMVAYRTLRGTVLQMVKHKEVHLPNLKALTLEQCVCNDYMAPVTRTELRDTKSFTELSRKSAEVGVFLSVTKYGCSHSGNDEGVFQAYMP